MSLRILFADDSMTAQNMGKKILTEAGYEVVAVSNGAAAVKKIAEHKPDIIILDVYMPGYSGLEVCEKVRSSIDTLKTPVLLTVGKMEPYKPEDANRVKADGVIIKPFEASDLLAIVKKLEERIAPSVAPPLVQQTIRLERPPDFAEFAVHSTGNSSAAVATVAVPTPEELDENTVQPTVDVPDHMATVSAFSDLLGTDMLAPVEFSAPVAPERPVEVAPARVSPDPSSTFTSIPELEVPPPIASAPEIAPAQAWESSAALNQDFAVQAEPTSALDAVPEAETPPLIHPVATQSIEVHTIEVAPIQAAPPIEARSEAALPEIEEALAPATSSESSAPANPEGVYPDTQPIPVYQEPESHASQVETGEISTEPAAVVIATEAAPVENYPLETTQAQNIAEANTGMEPGLEPTIQAQAEVTSLADPNLVSDRAALEDFPTRFGVQNPEEIPVGIASDMPVFDAAPVGAHATVEAEDVEAHEVVAEPAAAVPASSDDDFEARVAAAMDLYAEPVATETEPAQEVESEQVAHAAQTVAPEDDFEARVAVAMSIYEEPQPAMALADEVQPSAIHATTEVPPVSEPEPVEPRIESVPALRSPVENTSVEPEPPAVAAEEPPSFEYSPPVIAPRLHPELEVPRESQIHIAPAIHTEVVAEQLDHAIGESYTRAVESEPASSLLPVAVAVAQDVSYITDSAVRTPEPEPANQAQIAASIEAEMPVEAVAAAAVATGADHEVVAQVVHRVMERLKPELIAAIVRELNSQK